MPRRPEDVPPAVADELLQALLHDGRPPAQSGADNGAPVLFVHGLGHDAWDFGPVVERVLRTAPSLSLRAFDLPGFGPALAEKPPTAITLADLTAALVAQAKACARPPVVVASSLGGHVALMAALAEPGLFAGLSLLAPGGLVAVPTPTQAVLRAYYTVDAIMGRADADIVRNSRRIFVRPVEASDRLATRKLAWHRASTANKERFAVPFSSIVDDVFRRYVGDVVHRLKGLPMQVIFGEGDVVVPLASGRLLERNAGASLHIMRGVGHTPHLEDPDTTWRLIERFVLSMQGEPNVPR